MWIDKLARGVIQLETPIGPRYLQPDFVQRAALMWTFRNFFSLPHQVLRCSERQLIDRLLQENRFVSMSTVGPSRPVIGRIERRVFNRRNDAAAQTGHGRAIRDLEAGQGSRLGLDLFRQVSGANHVDWIPFRKTFQVLFLHGAELMHAAGFPAWVSRSRMV